MLNSLLSNYLFLIFLCYLTKSVNRLKSSKNLSYDVAVDVGQTIVAALDAEGQSLMVEPKQMQQRGV